MKNKLILAWLTLLSVGYFIGWTYTYDTDTPVGTDAPSVIDDRIREVKDAVQERQNVDHYWTLTGSQVSDADAGKHRQVTFRAPLDSDPSSVDEDEGELYTKDVSSKAELHWIDEDENVIQITSAGAIVGNMTADSIGATEIQIANDTYLKAANAAGDGEISLIKANSSDEIVLGAVATLIDSSQLASSAAPTDDADISNKKYVDDQIAAAVPDDDAFGAWLGKTPDTVYLAATDGFVCAGSTEGTTNDLKGYTDSSNPPTTLRLKSVLFVSGASISSITMPVRKGDYWKVTGASWIYWLPVGG